MTSHDSYEHNTVLPMLDRNRRVKRAPEKFQLNRDVFDVIITCETKVFDAACEGRHMRVCVAGHACA